MPAAPAVAVCDGRNAGRRDRRRIQWGRGRGIVTAVWTLGAGWHGDDARRQRPAGIPVMAIPGGLSGTPLGALTLNSSPREVAAAIIHEARGAAIHPVKRCQFWPTPCRKADSIPRRSAQTACGKTSSSRTHRILVATTRTWPSRSSSTVSTSTAARHHPTSGKSIFWLQQRPGDATADIAYSRGDTHT